MIRCLFCLVPLGPPVGHPVPQDVSKSNGGEFDKVRQTIDQEYYQKCHVWAGHSRSKWPPVIDQSCNDYCQRSVISLCTIILGRLWCKTGKMLVAFKQAPGIYISEKCGHLLVSSFLGCQGKTGLICTWKHEDDIFSNIK